MNTLPSRRQFLQTLAWVPLMATGLTGCGGSSGDVAPDLPKVAVSTRRLAFSTLGDSVEALPNENLVVQINSATRKGWQYGGDFGQDAVLLTPWAVIATETRRFILERARQRVVVLDADVQLLRTLGGRDAGLHPLRTPGIPAPGPDGLIYVPDRGLGLIRAFDITSQTVRTLAQDVGLVAPYALAFDPAGRMHVLQSSSQVVILDLDGREVGRYGGRGARPGQMAMPTSIAVDPQGWVTLADPVMAALHHFDVNGSFVASRRVAHANGAPAMPFLLALRHDGVLHVQASFDSSAGAVHRLYPHLI
jgi:DNA-binding beta-propeller fold protein YncE